jgi:hypothetical protein
MGILSMLVAGCGGLDLLPVTGTVTLDGKPVGDAAVTFSPTAGGPVASGTTDAAGHFQLTTTNRAGVMPGEYTVTITKQTMHNITSDGMPGPGGVKIQWHVPRRYSEPESSGLKAVVRREKLELKFELVSN